MASLSEERAQLVALLGLPVDNPNYSIAQLKQLAEAPLEDRQTSSLFNEAGQLNTGTPNVEAYAHNPAWASNNNYVVGQSVMSPSNEPVVCLVAHTSGTSFALDQAAGKWSVPSITYQPFNAGGNRLIVLGDSTGLGNDTLDSDSDSWPTYAAGLSGWKIWHLHSTSSVIGNTSTQALGRWNTDVAPYKPNLVAWNLGANDITTGASFATFQANAQSFVSMCRALGALPIFCTIAPSEVSANRATVTQWNAWMRLYAQSISAPLLDWYSLLVDPVTGNYLSAYRADGIHPNPAGYYAMGNMANTVLGPLLKPGGVPFASDAIDPNNLLSASRSPFFLNTVLNANKEPQGWNVLNPASVSSATIITGDTAISGNWYQQTLANNSSVVELYSGSFPIPTGHVFALTGLVKVNLGGAPLYISSNTDVTNYPLVTRVNLTTPFRFWHVYTSTASGIQNFIFQVNAGATGTWQVAQLCCYDLTAMGIDGLLPPRP